MITLLPPLSPIEDCIDSHGRVNINKAFVRNFNRQTINAVS